MVLGQHFFNRTTDVTQTFAIVKYIPYPLYSVFNPSDHDLGEAGVQQGRGCGLCVPQGPEPEEGLGVGTRRAWENPQTLGGGGEGGSKSAWVTYGLGLAGGSPGWQPCWALGWPSCCLLGSQATAPLPSGAAPLGCTGPLLPVMGPCTAG